MARIPVEEFEDKDRGIAKGDGPSTLSQMEKTELAARVLKLNHNREQAKLVDEANNMTRWEPN